MLEPVWPSLPAQLFSPVTTGLLGIGPGKGVGPTYFWWLVSDCCSRSREAWVGWIVQGRWALCQGTLSFQDLSSSTGTGWIPRFMKKL